MNKESRVRLIPSSYKSLSLSEQVATLMKKFLRLSCESGLALVASPTD